MLLWMMNGVVEKKYVFRALDNSYCFPTTATAMLIISMRKFASVVPMIFTLV